METKRETVPMNCTIRNWLALGLVAAMLFMTACLGPPTASSISEVSLYSQTSAESSGDQTSELSPNQSSEPSSSETIQKTISEQGHYYNVDEIEGNFNATEYIAVAWQKGGLIRSEVKVFMDTVHWASDSRSIATLTTTSDLDGDGEEEQIEIQSDPDTGSMSVLLFMHGKTVNLFGLVSEEYLNAVKQMPGGDDGTNIPIYIDAACKDLGGDEKKEILLAVGNDNGALVVSLLKYTGGDLLYGEAGGIKGTNELRYFIITDENSLFAELYFANPLSNESLPMNYVEYAYNGIEISLLGCRDTSETKESVIVGTNQETEPGYSSDPQVEETVQQESFADYARIKTWYSTGGFSSDTAWVHFKAVDADGKTVLEVLGSDEMNMSEELDALAETPERWELVEQLRQDMTFAGWTEVGVADGGEWYEYVYGR